MRILNVTLSLDPIRGGTVERTVQMSRVLASKGQSCTVLTLDPGLTPERMNSMAGVTVVALPCLLKRFYVPALSLSTIRRLVGESDVIHLMSHWSLLNALVYYCARRLGKPYVICPAGSLRILGRSRLLKTLYNWVIGGRIIRNAERCIAITEKETADFVQLGVERERIAIIPNGIRLEEYSIKDDAAFRQAHRLPDAPFILFVGRLDPIKGPDQLLRAFCAIRNQFRHHLVFAGPDDGMLRELEDIVRRENVADRVHFLGYLGGAEKSQAYHAAELLVIPSRSEAMSIVVLEAGASATPVLVTDQCGFNDIDRIGGGMVVPATDEGIRAGLVNLLSRPGELGAMGNKLRQYTEKRFTWDSVVGRYLDLYADIMDRATRGRVALPGKP
jgi:glycosyltransferase involved in cell wall biosynthesis